MLLDDWSNQFQISYTEHILAKSALIVFKRRRFGARAPVQCRRLRSPNDLEAEKIAANSALFSSDTADRLCLVGTNFEDISTGGHSDNDKVTLILLAHWAIGRRKGCFSTDRPETSQASMPRGARLETAQCWESQIS